MTRTDGTASTRSARRGDTETHSATILPARGLRRAVFLRSGINNLLGKRLEALLRTRERVAYGLRPVGLVVELVDG